MTKTNMGDKQCELRNNFHSRGKSNRSDKQPEKLSAKKQKCDANYQSDNRDGTIQHIGTSSGPVYFCNHRFLDVMRNVCNSTLKTYANLAPHRKPSWIRGQRNLLTLILPKSWKWKFPIRR